MERLKFYFDPISPYAWLAAVELETPNLSRVEVEVVPVLLAGILSAHGQLGPAEIPAKRAYTFRDLLRQASRRGLSVEGPPTHPFNPLRALRCCVAIEALDTRRSFALQLMDSAWAKGRDITDPAVLAGVARSCQLNADELLRASEAVTAKDRLIHNTTRAISRGIFGVPTFEWAGEFYWGSDRMADLTQAIRGQGPKIDGDQLARMLARPASAHRPR